MSNVTEYGEGNTLIVTRTFTDPDSGDPVDPDKVIASYRYGNTTVSYVWTSGDPSPYITHLDTGVFQYSFFMSPKGSWSRQMEAVINGKAVTFPARFNVVQAPIVPTAP